MTYGIRTRAAAITTRGAAATPRSPFRCRHMTTVLQRSKICHSNPPLSQRDRAGFPDREKMSSSGRDERVRRSLEGTRGHGLEKIGKGVRGWSVRENKKPRFRWEAGLREILGSTRLSGSIRPESASVRRRITGKGHFFIRWRANALDHGTDDPAPSPCGLADEDVGALQLGSV